MAADVGGAWPVADVGGACPVAADVGGAWPVADVGGACPVAADVGGGRGGADVGERGGADVGERGGGGTPGAVLFGRASGGADGLGGPLHRDGLCDGGAGGGRDVGRDGRTLRDMRSGAFAVASSTSIDALISSASAAGGSSERNIDSLISSADGSLPRIGRSFAAPFPMPAAPTRAAPSVHGGGCVTAFGVVAFVEGTTIGGRSTSPSARTGSATGIPPSNASVARPLIDVGARGDTPGRVAGWASE